MMIYEICPLTFKLNQCCYLLVTLMMSVTRTKDIVMAISFSAEIQARPFRSSSIFLKEWLLRNKMDQV